MSLSLVHSEVVKKWDQHFAEGSDKRYPNLDLVRLEKWFLGGIPGRLLEYGHGSAVNLIHLLECGHDVDAVDASLEAKKLAERKLAKRSDLLPRVRLHHIGTGDTGLPFEDATFDYVTCLSTLSLLASGERVDLLLAEFARVMKADAKAILDINAPNADFARNSKPLGDDVYEFRGLSGNEQPVPTYCPKDAASFSERVARHLTIDDVGYAAHKYCGSEITEYIVCGHKA